ncbi:MAG: hypothetical protein KM312_06905 [Hydrogenibacillus schlegelii]|uniref:Uncharacterized protein n=1 Tax=Hydrogenibacillus schlegelii TaxID=1484 RepID=A0A947GHA3_HYDSH|nr:hypothetical protein [Hydrogenibacillus schlegelii]
MNLGQLLELIGQAASRPVDGRALMDVAKDVQRATRTTKRRCGRSSGGFRPSSA